jgi:two-component system sensor kinase FixL
MTRVVADIRRQDVELFDQAQRIRAILQTAADGIITIDKDGQILSTNPAAERIFRFRPGELLGRNINVLMPDPFHSEHDQYVQNFIRTRIPKIIGIGREVVGKRSDGSTFPLDLAVSAVSLDGRELFTGIVRDITERKAAEEELRDLNKKLQHHQQAMIQHEKMAAMGQMAAGVVHEISNPLANMDSLLQLAQRKPEKLNLETAESLREQVKRIARITRQLTDFAHPNEAGAEIHSVNDVVAGALDMVRFDHRIRRVEVKREFDSKPGCVRVTLPAIQQVVLNMVFNALDAMAKVDSPRLTVRTSRHDQWVVIEISDTGEGIAPEHLRRIFEPFFTTKPLGQGTGLGLSISYSLIQQHGGHCEVSSRVGEGTTFRIFLPRADANADSRATSYVRETAETPGS